ncbi:hypothetical protein TNCV_1863361 [Trichonephila clavipes]|nr:hypothetical protein TNCV_1863361 [Trichonephila clavipes]
MVLLEMALEAVDGLGTCVFCVDVDVTFRDRPLFRSGATGEVPMSYKSVNAENSTDKLCSVVTNNSSRCAMTHGNFFYESCNALTSTCLKKGK